MSVELPDVGDIVMRTEMDRALTRAVVVEAPPTAIVSAQVLAEIALGRSIDSDLSDLGLTLGVPGMGVGRVRYRVGEFDHDLHGYLVTRIEDPR